ncbi:MAG: Verru_Chthon cassette protein D [Verrucomicrobiaceae bacterium]|nr:Verru_Chthon cassette protein D [Verrucomicrobiaceae bacterium]
MKTLKYRERGFTLIEILVVLAIIAVIVTFTVPNLGPVLKGSKLKQAADDLERALSNAQQVALTQNHPVEFRFFRYNNPDSPGSEEHYRSYQAVQIITSPEDHRKVIEEKVITQVESFQLPFVLAEGQYSTLIDSDALEQGVADIPRSENAEYVAFEFRPNGATNLATVDMPHWTLTIVRDTDSKPVIGEFVTLTVDAYNGQIRQFNPGG